MKIVFKGNKILTLGGKTFSVAPNRYYVNITQVQNGTIYSDKQSATQGEIITLTYTALAGYDLDYFTLNGVAIVGNTFNMPAENVTVSGSFSINYNPLNLPANTIRVKMSAGATPTVSDATVTPVSGHEDEYDVTKSNWSNLFKSNNNLIEVIGANSSSITSMESMFENCSNLSSVAIFDTRNVTTMRYTFGSCSALTSVPLFDTSNLTDMYSMFRNCSSLTSIPLFDTSKVSNMNYAFYYCSRVEGGALALYQQASSQETPPSSHYDTFEGCGSYTSSGSAELAQIPSNWK